MLCEAVNDLFQASSEALFLQPPESDRLERRGAVLRGNEGFLSRAVKSLESLLADPWFSSLWTLQEAFLSPASGIVDRNGSVLKRSDAFHSQVLLSEVTRCCQGLSKACHRSAVMKRESMTPLGPWEHTLEDLIEKSGLVTMGQRNPMSLYTLANKRTTRDPCDRIYGIMQVFGFRLGASAKRADSQAVFTLPELETQLGGELLKELPLFSQLAVHTELMPFGQARRVHRSSVMPDLARELPYYHNSSIWGNFNATCDLSTTSHNNTTLAHFRGRVLPFSRLFEVCRAVNEAEIYRYRNPEYGIGLDYAGQSCFQLTIDVSEGTLIKSSYLSTQKLWQIPLQ